MEPSDRRPAYAKARDKRVVSCANGQWQAQRHAGHSGTRESDPWQPLGRPTTYDNAIRQRGE